MELFGRAATVILYRQCQEGYEVFMTQRSVQTQSFPGFWVFPGGREHPDDSVVAAHLRQEPVLNLVVEQQQFQETMSRDFVMSMGYLPSLEIRPAFGLPDWQSLVVTALRELWEETGMAYTKPVLIQDERVAIQQALLEGTPLLRLMDRYHFELDAGALTAIGRITTPNLGEKVRRFDTAFFMVPARNEAEPLRNSAEVAATCWLTPAQALKQYGSILAIPTRYILMQLEKKVWGESMS
ncbi:MAG: NUDIX domain-containing protein [Firmicutes bacterium]|jgi:8-oxo-dGTP pyrophosphatase MutT (NUDIX family)|uniref:Nudix hydrolase domain-containing protein n=1 Tax=Sulfobacillus benefaciens TaxID=453960 RepID=A0A2T2X0J9_9FIRM|nr:NUDIX domain-containing protein [Bacillota bacterium]MCL5014946.1 NUDIX domain-containing protein [Bacillota bacterium]PSR28020.1 MAG: hypothetical protein C7B43_10710 [Sulfobacillus benefaciens]